MSGVSPLGPRINNVPGRRDDSSRDNRPDGEVAPRRVNPVGNINPNDEWLSTSINPTKNRDGNVINTKHSEEDNLRIHSNVIALDALSTAVTEAIQTTNINMSSKSRLTDKVVRLFRSKDLSEEENSTLSNSGIHPSAPELTEEQRAILGIFATLSKDQQSVAIEKLKSILESKSFRLSSVSIDGGAMVSMWDYTPGTRT